MSRGQAGVRFADGAVKWCLYDGTNDMMIPGLFDDPMSPWDSYYERSGLGEGDSWPEAQGEVEHVEICITYGGDTWLHGKATRNRVVWPIDFLGEDLIEEFDGRPDWYSSAYQAAYEKGRREQAQDQS